MQLRRGQAVNYWLGADEEPIEHALRDLSKDLKSVLAAGLRRSGRPGQADLVLVNLQHTPWPGLKIKKNEWERYQIAVKDDQVVIAGSDTRGVLFGIYQFSRRALGVDPICFWIPSTSRALDRVDPAAAVTVSASPTFKYRGWFVGDEDLLDGWDYGGYREGAKFKSGRGKAISYETYEKLFETMLRLRVNLVIPALILDVFDEGVPEILDRIRARGLMFSFHHVEPVGVSPGHEFAHYCRLEGIEADFSWVKNRQVVEDCWRRYIDRIAEYADSVIWQLGYRGSTDTPFWNTELDAPEDWPGRGAVVSGAIRRQLELIRERVGSECRIVATAALWSEGNVLYRMGLLDLPEEVIPITADVARTQSLPDPFPTVEAGRRHGIYYHVSYYSTGPHLISGNPGQNLAANYRRALEAGATEYVLLMVSNTRPFLPEIQAGAEIAFDAEHFNEKTFLGAFCKEHFGSAEIRKLYESYYATFVHLPEKHLREQNFRWLDGSLVLMVKHVLDLLERSGSMTGETYRRFMKIGFRLGLLTEVPPIPDEIDVDDPRLWLCKDWRSLCEYAFPLLAESERRWTALIERIEEKRPEITRDLPLYDYGLHWASLAALSMTQSAGSSLQTVLALLADRPDQAAGHLQRAADGMGKLFGSAARLAEQEHFAGWMGGDWYLGLRSVEARMAAMAERLRQSGSPALPAP